MIKAFALGVKFITSFQTPRVFFFFAWHRKPWRELLFLRVIPLPSCKYTPSLQDGSIAFTNQDNKQLPILRSGGAVKVIAGTGEESNKNGPGSHSAFGQPMGVGTEGPSIFVTDGQIGTIKLVTNLELLSSWRTSENCTAHHKHQQHKNCTLKEAHQTVKTVSSYYNAPIEKLK